MKKSNVLILGLQLLACTPMTLASDHTLHRYQQYSTDLQNIEQRNDETSLVLKKQRHKNDKNKSERNYELIQEAKDKMAKIVGKTKEMFDQDITEIENDQTLTKEQKQIQRRKILKLKLGARKNLNKALAGRRNPA